MLTARDRTLLWLWIAVWIVVLVSMRGQQIPAGLFFFAFFPAMVLIADFIVSSQRSHND